MSPRGVLLSFVLALVVFSVVQDRITAAGARQYVRLQRAAMREGGRPVTVDEVMGPANRRARRVAGAWALGVLVGGVLLSSRGAIRAGR